MKKTSCPALFIGAPATGQGKTSVVAGLARLHSRLGRKVAVFKCGPDFLDPMIHGYASSRPCLNIDLWMCGEEDAAYRLARAAEEADLILIEGVSGLFDGSPSGADLARRFQIPVVAVIGAGVMAGTFGAIAYGLAKYQPDLPFYGVVATRLRNMNHTQLVMTGLSNGASAGIRWCGGIPSDEMASLPSRKMGLYLPQEFADLATRLDRIADYLAKTALAELPPAVNFPLPESKPVPKLLAGRRIAVARDSAFAFVYPANIDCLRVLGASVQVYSPLANEPLPDCDALWLPGGYTEMHAAFLAKQSSYHQQLRDHVAAGKPLLAECGGMMSLFKTLTDKKETMYRMAGVLQGKVQMHARLKSIGAQQADLPEGTLRGHTYHYATATTKLAPLVRARRLSDGVLTIGGEAVYRQDRLTATFMHFYFPSNPAATAALFLP